MLVLATSRPVPPEPATEALWVTATPSHRQCSRARCTRIWATVPRRRTGCLHVRLVVTSRPVLMGAKTLMEGPTAHTRATHTSRLAPHINHPAPHTSHPAPHTSHPAPRTSYPALRTSHPAPHTTTGVMGTLPALSTTSPTAVWRMLIPDTLTLDPTPMWQGMVRVLSKHRQRRFNAARRPSASPPRN